MIKTNIRRSLGLAILTIIFSLLYSVMMVCIAIILQNVVDQVIAQKSIKIFTIMMVETSLYILVLSFVFFTYNLFLNKFVKSVLISIRFDVFDGIVNRNYQSFFINDSSDYISALTNDINIIESNYIRPYLSIFENIFIFIATLVLLFKYSAAMAFVLLLLLFVALLVPNYLGKIMRKKQYHFSQNMAAFISKLKDYFSGFEVIKTYSIIQIIEHKFKKENESVAVSKYEKDQMEAINNTASCFLSSCIQFSILFIGAYQIIRDQISLGSLLALLQLSSLFTNPISVIMQDISLIKSTDPIIKRLESFSFKTNNSSIKALKFNQSITLNNISFAYPEGSVVLSNICLKIEKNKKYAIVGKSGSGKSTLIKILSGYYNPYSGTIRYDDNDIIGIKGERLYKIENLFSIVHQNVFMFNGTILDNICLFQDYDSKRLSKALSLSGVDLFLNNCPDGILTQIGENGNQLSGGQKQRIAVARSLLRETPILIFDEGTSSIDRQTGADIEKNIISMKNITFIAVTHSLDESILQKYDKIIFLQCGKILEQGTFESLIKSKGAFYNYFKLNC